MEILIQALSLLVLVYAIFLNRESRRQWKSLAGLKLQVEQAITSSKDREERIESALTEISSWSENLSGMGGLGLSAWLQAQAGHLQTNLKVHHFSENIGSPPYKGAATILAPKNVFEWGILALLSGWIIFLAKPEELWVWGAFPFLAYTAALVLNSQSQQNMMLLNDGFQHMANLCGQPFHDRTLENRITNALIEIDKNTGRLESTLSSHQLAVEKMPNNFSEEVQKGLTQTMEVLALSLRHFETLLQHIPNIEYMPSWLKSLEQTIVPLRQVGDRVAKLYDKNENILSVLSEIVRETAEDRREFMTQAKTTSNGLSEWTTAQQTMSNEFESKLNDYLAKMNSIASHSQESLDKVADFTAKTGHIMDDIGNALPNTARTLQKVGDQLELATRRFDESSMKVLQQAKGLRIGLWVFSGIALAALALSLVNYFQ